MGENAKLKEGHSIDKHGKSLTLKSKLLLLKRQKHFSNNLL